jgi:hypothetical protein
MCVLYGGWGKNASRTAWVWYGDPLASRHLRFCAVAKTMVIVNGGFLPYLTSSSVFIKYYFKIKSILVEAKMKIMKNRNDYGSIPLFSAANK